MGCGGVAVYGMTLRVHQPRVKLRGWRSRRTYLGLWIWLLSKRRAWSSAIGSRKRRLAEGLAGVGRSWRRTVLCSRRWSGASTAHLIALLLLLGLQGRGSGLDEGILDRSDNSKREDRSGVDGAGHGLFPGL